MTVALLVASTVGSWPGAAFAGDSSAGKSSVAAASYSVGERGSKLEWLPYRPGKLRTDNRVIAAAHFAAAGDADTSVRTAQLNIGPIPNPFDRSDDTPDDSGPSGPVDDEILKGPTAEPRPDDFPSVFPNAAQPFADDEPEQAGQGAPGEEFDPGYDPLRDRRIARDEESHCDVEKLKKITELDPTEWIKPPAPDETVADRTTKDVLEIYCKVPESAGTVLNRQHWAGTTFMWKASGLCHKPLYFEDVHLERYGHSWGPYLQPVMSGAHFFLTVPVLPYKMGLYPPGECIYTLGDYRPGSCAPYMLDPIPLSVRATLFQAAAWTGGIYVVP